MRLPDYPVRQALPDLCRALSGAGRAVLAAPPGSGKTTVVPLELLDQPWLAGQRIVMLEPRRVAARASAARMAHLLGEAVGHTVGYQVRFERRVSPATRIEVVTEGLLTRRLQADPDLPGVGLLIFDEFHERSLDADLALALSLDARANLRPDLRVLVMSATLDTARVSALLDDAPVVEAGGRLFDVQVHWLGAPRAGQRLDEAMSAAIRRGLQETAGDVLAFLPGGREIRGVQRLLEARGANLALRPLHGELTSDEQDLALAPDAAGRRKVILATNIAQTSLTVEGVTTVVDSGLVRAARFDLGAGADQLQTLRVSRASAEQRAGRAGRLGPGTAYRLWSADQHGALAAHDTPEILAADLARLALELALWGAREAAELRWLDPPAGPAWACARTLLRDLGAVDTDGRITAHGRQLARLPAAPRLAHLLVLARERGMADAGAWLAACLEARDAERGTDLVARVQQARAGGGGEPRTQRRLAEAARQYRRLLDSARAAPVPTDHEAAALAELVSQAYPERLARRRQGLRETHVAGQREVAFLCADGGEARLPEHDPLARSAWLAIAQWDLAGDRRGIAATRRVRLAAALDETRVREAHAGRITVHRQVHWDPVQERVVAEEQERLGSLVLAARRLGDAGEPARQAMLEGLRSLGLQALPWTEAARQWQARVLSLRQWEGGGDWPDVSDAALLDTLDHWLGPWLDGVTRRAHLADLDLTAILQAQLEPVARQRLDRLAPTHLPVPSGLRRPVIYAADAAPHLEVKLQEMFGCTRTPSVCDGRVPVVLHLLSPAQRPVAVTQDLPGFWDRGYAEVRKDLRGRYPRHPWPEDPRSASATHRAKPRGT